MGTSCRCTHHHSFRNGSSTRSGILFQFNAIIQRLQLFLMLFIVLALCWIATKQTRQTVVQLQNDHVDKVEQDQCQRLVPEDALIVDNDIECCHGNTIEAGISHDWICIQFADSCGDQCAQGNDEEYVEDSRTDDRTNCKKQINESF